MTARLTGADLPGQPPAASGASLGSLAPCLGACVAFLCGLAIPFNVILLTLSGQDFRLLDAASVVILPIALWLSLRRAHVLLSLVVLGVLFFLPSLIQAAVLLARYDESSDVVFPARFLMAIALCGALIPLLEQALHRTWFTIGMCLGCSLNIVPLIFERLGQHETMVALGLAPSHLAIEPWDLVLRPPGLHGHANATTAVVSLAIPVAAFAAGSGPRRWWLLSLASITLLVCVYYTETRSAVLVSLATLACAIAFRWRPVSVLMLALVLVLVGLVAAGWRDGPLLPESFARLDTADANATERFATMTAGFRVMLEQPWGLGRTLGGAAVYEITGVGARGATASHDVSVPTHNSFVWLGVAFGLVPAAFTVVGLAAMVTHAGRLDAGGLRALLAFHLIGLCLFEDHFQNATFINLLALLLGGWLAELLAPTPRQAGAWRSGGRPSPLPGLETAAGPVAWWGRPGNVGP
jgi:hypothetical protein